MPVLDIVALALGVGITLGVGLLAVGVVDSPDESMRWEGGVAVGFAGLIFLGPFWVGQAVLTVIATVTDGGLAPGWLWAWLFLAPALGATPPTVAMARLLRRLFTRRPG